jgi:hypothetical protein
MRVYRGRLKTSHTNIGHRDLKPFNGIQNGHINVIAKMSESFRQK